MTVVLSSWRLSGSPQHAANTRTVFLFHSQRGFSHSSLATTVVHDPPPKLTEGGVQSSGGPRSRCRSLWVVTACLLFFFLCLQWDKPGLRRGRIEGEGDGSTWSPLGATAAVCRLLMSGKKTLLNSSLCPTLSLCVGAWSVSYKQEFL